MTITEPLTTEEIDDNIRRLGHVRATLDAEYRETQDRLRRLGGNRAAVEDAILTLAGRLLSETGKGDVVTAGQIIGSARTENSRGSHVRFETRQDGTVRDHGRPPVRDEP